MKGQANSSVELRTGRCMNTPVLSPVAGGTAAVFSCRAPRAEDEPSHRSTNEDGCLLVRVDAARGVMAVADGLGGQPGGDHACGLALHALASAVKSPAPKKEHDGDGGARGDAVLLRDRILDGFEIANQAVSQLGIGAGTTLAVVEIDGRAIRPYHAGDSMILVVGNQGKLKLQTISHSPVGYAVESGMLEERDAMHHEERHVVSNLVGAESMRIEIGPTVELAPRDTVVLASDGLFDNLHVEEIVECIRKGPLETGAKQLVESAQRRMQSPREGEPSKPDDLTFIAYRPD